MRVCLALLAFVALATPASADLVFLKSGKIISGTITEGPDGLEVTGNGGKVTISHTLVERFELGRTLASLIAEKFKGTEADADSLYGLGKWFSKHGLGTQANTAWRRAIMIEPDHLLARRALGQVKDNGQWVGHGELAKKAGLVKRGSRWVVPTKPLPTSGSFEQIPAAGPERLAWAKKRLPVVIKTSVMGGDAKQRAEAAVARRRVVRSLVEVMLRHEEPTYRARAQDILGTNEEISAVPSLVRSSIADRSKAVRGNAVRALNKINMPNAPLYYMKALECEIPTVRKHAIEALGGMNGQMATEVLVKTIMNVYGGGPRVHIFIGRQLAYVKDYDVEVAQNSSIADPEIGYVTDGIVLDFKVFRIVEYITLAETRLIAKQLEKKSGLALGPNPEKWMAWWREEQKKKKAGGKKGS